MRIGILSDSHGDKKNIVKALQEMGKVDFLFHLGDYAKDAEYIKDFYKGEIIAVHGNCDHFTGLGSYPPEVLLTIEGKNVFATHGHRYRVKDGLNTLYYRGKEIEADIILFGHTHCSKIIKIDEMVMMNPGSVSSSRNKSRSTYGIIEITDDEVKADILEI
ncbi:MAG: metallophosphoesterase [Bacillota bacterium]|nr:metallophosphoesterase [Bacillota bacterium]